MVKSNALLLNWRKIQMLSLLILLIIIQKNFHGIISKRMLIFIRE